MVKKLGCKPNNIWIYLLLLVVMIVVINGKKNLMVDEVLTYHLSNNAGPGILENLEEGKLFTPAESIFLSYITVPNDGRFDYANVWKRQQGDVHPPLYYALVHSICSMFPNQYSEWYAGIVNIVFGLLTLWCIRRIVDEMTHNKTVILLCSLSYMTAAGILSAILFLRMYVMAMFFVSLITYLFLKTVDDGLSVRTSISMILATVSGALTHYYFIIYLFFISLIFGIYMLVRRKIKQVAMFVLSMAIAGGVSILIFPGMVQHIFLNGSNGYRGRESFANLTDGLISEYIWNLIVFAGRALFSGIFIGLLATVFLVLVMLLVSKFKRGAKQDWLAIDSKNVLRLGRVPVKWILLILPSICYFFLVSKIAISRADRYMYPIYAVTLVWGLCILYEVCIRIVKKKVYQHIVMGVLLAVGIINSWLMYPWNNIGDVRLLEALMPYNHCNSIYVYDQRYRILASFYEVSLQKGVIFWNQNNIDLLDNAECKMDEEMIVYIVDTCDQQAVLDKVLELCPSLDSCEEIGSCGYATAYYLYGSKLLSEAEMGLL